MHLIAWLPNASHVRLALLPHRVLPPLVVSGKTLVGCVLAHRKVKAASGAGWFRCSGHGMVTETLISMSLSVWGSDMTCDALCAHRCDDSFVATVTWMRCDPYPGVICASVHRDPGRQNVGVATSNESVICVYGDASGVCVIVSHRPRRCGVCAYSCGRHRRLCGVGFCACAYFPSCRFHRLFQLLARAYVSLRGRSS
jgi:hypothetical protein